MSKSVRILKRSEGGKWQLCMISQVPSRQPSLVLAGYAVKPFQCMQDMLVYRRGDCPERLKFFLGERGHTCSHGYFGDGADDMYRRDEDREHTTPVWLEIRR